MCGRCMDAKFDIKKMFVIANRNFQQNFTPMVIVLEPVRDSGVYSEVWQLSRQ